MRAGQPAFGERKRPLELRFRGKGIAALFPALGEIAVNERFRAIEGRVDVLRGGREGQYPSRVGDGGKALAARSEEHTSELQSLMRISYAVFCLTKKTQITAHT